jgi:SAM-dependent methyltransferase
VGVEEGRLERPPRHWYLPLAQHLGEAYFRYSFTQGTEQEVGFLYDALCLTEGCRLLDVGAGPGRHAIELAARGVQVVAVDSSPKFMNMGRRLAQEAGVDGVSFFEMDACELPFEEEFDAVMSICEGAFGLGIEDLKILRGIARALKPGGHAAVASAHVYHLLSGPHSGTFDPASALFKQTQEVVGEDGSIKSFEMWNSCYTPRELEWIANGAGLDPQFVSGVAPGQFRGQTPSFAHPELLLLARKPLDSSGSQPVS